MSCRLWEQPLPSFDLGYCFSQLHIGFPFHGRELGRASQRGIEVILSRQDYVCRQGCIRGLIHPLESKCPLRLSGSFIISAVPSTSLLGLKFIHKWKRIFTYHSHSIALSSVLSGHLPTESFHLVLYLLHSSALYTDYRASQHQPMNWEKRAECDS